MSEPYEPEEFDVLETEAQVQSEAEREAREAQAVAATIAALRVLIDDGREVEALALAKHWEGLEEWAQNTIEAKRIEAKRQAAFKNPAMQPEAERPAERSQGVTIQKKKLIDLDLKAVKVEPELAAKQKSERRTQLDELVAQEMRRTALFAELADVFESDNSVERSKYNTQKAEVALAEGITQMDVHRAVTQEIENRKKAKPAELTQSQKAVALVLGERFRLWSDPTDQAEYASFTVAGHWENYAIGSAEFERLIRIEFLTRHSKEVGGVRVPGIINKDALNEMVLTAKAQAWASEAEAVAVLRLGGWNGEIWLDLGRKDWTLVLVTAEGWRFWTGGQPHVAFVRRRGMLALPMPVKGGEIRELRRFLNVKDGEFVLLVGWLLGALRVLGPHAIAAITGSSDAGKTTVCRVLVALIDPNLANLVSLTTPDNMYVAAYNRRVIAFDNVSAIDTEQADALSKISTGNGYTKRAMRTNAQQFMMYALAPMMFNGIPPNLAERSDLATRVIAIELPGFVGDTEGGEEEFWREFEVAQPRLLGALLDGVVGAMRGAASVSLAGRGRVRMADFARWAEAGCRALGFAEGEFLTALVTNQRRSLQLVFAQDPIAQAVVLLIEQQGCWRGTVRPLLAALAKAARKAKQEDLLARGWPTNDVHLGRKLRRSEAVLLKLCDIQITYGIDLRPEGGKDGIEIKRVGTVGEGVGEVGE